jgi:hypothetical protein
MIKKGLMFIIKATIIFNNLWKVYSGLEGEILVGLNPTKIANFSDIYIILILYRYPNIAGTCKIIKL